MRTATTIRRVDIHPLDLPLKEPFITSLGATSTAENVAVIVHTDAGIVGQGECCPYAPITGETQDTCLAMAPLLARALLGHHAADIPGAVALMDRVVHGNSGIKSAFDIALHDIAAQEAGLPLYRYLGGTEPRTLVTDYTVSIGDAQRMAEEARAIVAKGFTVVKVKLGGDPATDIDRVRRIRQAIGPSVPLRLDANQGWDPAGAIQVLCALADAGVEHCEEPIARWRFMELKAVKEASPIPVLADESCFDHRDAERLIALGACDGFNIKLGKSGGLHKAGLIARAGADAGLRLQIGGFLESRLAWTAAAHLAIAHPAIRWCDMDTPLMHTTDPIHGGIVYGPGGTITLPEGPGLGATFGPAMLTSGRMHSVE